MWHSIATQNKVTAAIVLKSVLSTGARPFEKVSAALAVRQALTQKTPNALFFVVPEATAATSRYLTAGLLVGNYAHSHGSGQLPPEEARPLFSGDLLVVTSAVSECKSELDSLKIGNNQRLRDLWDVITYSKYTSPQSTKPRVFLANPGWLLKGVDERRFGAVVIDAAHPRTHGVIIELTRVASRISPLQFVVMPPLSEAAIRACGYPDHAAIWLWDPPTVMDVQSEIGRGGEKIALGERFLWVCDGDSEASDALAKVYQQLSRASKAGASKRYPGLPLCWSIYDRLRQLTVPLAHLEQVAASSWSGSLRDRIDALKSVSGHGDAAWETTWPPLHEAVCHAYDTFLKREETAKFWALASRLSTSASVPNGRLRIVLSSGEEAALLLTALSQIVDGVGDMLAKGLVEIVTTAGEARLVAEGHCSATYLLGPRSAKHRYLDAFASNRIDEFVYPHEVAVERASQTRLYNWYESTGTPSKRNGFLFALGFSAAQGLSNQSKSERPFTAVGAADRHEVALLHSADVSQTLDIAALVDDFEGDSVDTGSGAIRDAWQADSQGDLVEISFSDGDTRRYYAGANIDVFFSETGVVQRCSVTEVQPGWQVIAFVDGSYDSLFTRLTEVVNSRLPPHERVALDLWQKAKDDLFARYRNKTELYQKLLSQGLQSSYEAFMNWFDSIEGNLAPQQFDEFEIVAKECAAYKSATLIAATFSAVQQRRGRNRACGRQLKKFLRALVSGSGYDEALESARQLDTALGDVLAAVEVLEVQSMRVVQRIIDGKREPNLFA